MSSMHNAGRRSVLFICIHNSARSQMAEAFLKQMGGDYFTVASAGLEAGQMNPLAVEVMQELGMDISGQSVNGVFDFIREEKQFDYIITVCDDASGERCPLFPGAAERLHWPLDDPAALSGSQQEKMEKLREIRDQIRQRVAWFIQERKLA